MPEMPSRSIDFTVSEESEVENEFCAKARAILKANVQATAVKYL